MTRKLSKTIEFVSIHIVTALTKINVMSDDECGRWVKKALTDMAIGCIGNDVDPCVRSAFEDSLQLVEKSREAKRKYRERKKNKDAYKKPEQLIYGSFENVFLSQEEFNDLAPRFGSIPDLNKAIENLSAKLEDGSTESKNHYATLAYWAQCREYKQESKDTQPRYLSAIEKTMMAGEEALRMVHENYGTR